MKLLLSVIVGTFPNSLAEDPSCFVVVLISLPCDRLQLIYAVISAMSSLVRRYVRMAGLKCDMLFQIGALNLLRAKILLFQSCLRPLICYCCHTYSTASLFAFL